jgi:hypothetical protein
MLAVTVLDSVSASNYHVLDRKTQEGQTYLCKNPPETIFSRFAPAVPLLGNYL